MVFVYVYIKFIIISSETYRETYSVGVPCARLSWGALCPSKSGLINKHIVKHEVSGSLSV